jgi:hypothetical protein
LGLAALPPSARPLWERSGFVVSEYVLSDRVSRAAYDADGHELIEIVENGRRQTRLYDLRRDPAEEHPIDPSPDAAGGQLDDALRQMEAALPPSMPGPVVFPAADTSLAERLRRLGYVQ